MPDWLRVNAMNTPTVYSGMRFVTLPPKATIKRDGDGCQHDDAGIEREPVAAELELAREEAVAGEDARQAREVSERRVRGEDEQHGGRDLDEVEVWRTRAHERRP